MWGFFARVCNDDATACIQIKSMPERSASKDNDVNHADAPTTTAITAHLITMRSYYFHAYPASRAAAQRMRRTAARRSARNPPQASPPATGWAPSWATTRRPRTRRTRTGGRARMRRRCQCHRSSGAARWASHRPLFCRWELVRCSELRVRRMRI